MKINPLGTSGINPYKKQIDKLAQIEKAAGKRDEVQISTQAKELQQTNQVVTERQKKIDELKQQIQNGTYQIDAKKIAKGLVDFYKK
ncbi:flagellar biosynthesis anti-sigma factor FlgM [Priestia koreensis]|uniref:flagellar biosynthesis anti-sigma factor FlgM n=1 Tax=Priestia koreensis TaxID=284581 RepID=UPI001F59F4C8|nr:flagellar biosynthesis anti-sigma factor FlgM [Priestia koreensis]UNL84790.1 flagellar biosynthesis anti-sigma factor FlgM [Priestia koreensis]